MSPMRCGFKGIVALVFLLELSEFERTERATRDVREEEKTEYTSREKERELIKSFKFSFAEEEGNGGKGSLILYCKLGGIQRWEATFLPWRTPAGRRTG